MNLEENQQARLVLPYKPSDSADCSPRGWLTMVSIASKKQAVGTGCSRLTSLNTASWRCSLPRIPASSHLGLSLLWNASEFSARRKAPEDTAIRRCFERPAPSRDAASGPCTCSRAAVRRGRADRGLRSYPPFRPLRAAVDR